MKLEAIIINVKVYSSRNNKPDRHKKWTGGMIHGFVLILKTAIQAAHQKTNPTVYKHKHKHKNESLHAVGGDWILHYLALTTSFSLRPLSFSPWYSHCVPSQIEK